MLRITLILALTLTAAPSLAQGRAQAPSPLVKALDNCRQIQPDAARLACFDRTAGELLSAVGQGNVAVIDQDQARKARRSLFGFTIPDFLFLGRKGKDVEEPKELVTTLKSFGDIGLGRYRFTVADGDARWETTDRAELYEPKPGEKVTLRRGALGGYFVQIGSQNWVRARRVN